MRLQRRGCDQRHRLETPYASDTLKKCARPVSTSKRPSIAFAYCKRVTNPIGRPHFRLRTRLNDVTSAFITQENPQTKIGKTFDFQLEEALGASKDRVNFTFSIRTHAARAPRRPGPGRQRLIDCYPGQGSVEAP